MIEIRCPHCNKKAADCSNKDVLLEVLCFRCRCTFKIDNGVYSHEPPKQKSFKERYEKLKYLSYQDRLNLKKK
jgi:phage FluMu protein Com